jgi:toxin YoeB
MDVMTYSDARAQLKGVMDRAIHDKQEVVVTRKKGESVVVVSLDTWNAVNETLHLLSTPKNASRLRVKLVFSDQAWEDYQYWVNTNDKVRDRINELIKQCKRTPFKGTGKPEPLKGDLTGWWSRRISQEDRMVYRVSGAGDGQSLEIAQLRFHY